MPRVRRSLRHAATLLERGLAEFFADGCTQQAGAISFFSLFSLFPLAILMVGIFGLAVQDDAARRSVIDAVLSNLPLREDQGRRELNQVLRSVTGGVGGFGAVGLVGLVFSASGIMGAIRHALNVAWDERDVRPPLQGKLRDVVAVFAMGLVVAASFALTALDQLAGRLHDAIARLGAVPRTIADVLLSLGHLGPLLLVFGVFLALLHFVPESTPRLRDVWPGALLAAVGVEVAKSLFALYLEHLADYSAVYASLGTIIALLVFVYVAANVFLLGAEVASEWPAVRAGAYDAAGDAEPLRRRVWRGLRGLVVR